MKSASKYAASREASLRVLPLVPATLASAFAAAVAAGTSAASMRPAAKPAEQPAEHSERRGTRQCSQQLDELFSQPYTDITIRASSMVTVFAPFRGPSRLIDADSYNLKLMLQHFSRAARYLYLIPDVCEFRDFTPFFLQF